jgi:hypothetical protein
MHNMKMIACIAALGALSSFAAAPVAFKDAAKIKSWDAWNDHKGPQKWKERPCVTWRKLNAVDPGLKRIGTLKTRTAKEIRSSRWSVGCETLDRDYADWDQYKRFLGDLGAKRGRLFSLRVDFKSKIQRFFPGKSSFFLSNVHEHGHEIVF